MAHKELKYDVDARKALELGVDAVANAVKVTLGPRGRYVVLDKKFGAPTITNDGVTIAREIEVEDVFQNQGAQLVREVATATNDVAGDGTTTATVLAQAIVRQGLKNVTAGANPLALKRGIEQAVDAVVENIRSQSKEVSGKDQIARVATISAGDEEILAVHRDLRAAVLGVEDLVALRDVERDALLAFVVVAAVADRDDLALLGLLLGGVREDDATRRGLLLLDRPDDQAVAQRLELHGRFLR